MLKKGLTVKANPFFPQDYSCLAISSAFVVM